MSALINLFRELIGLFVDDGALALAILTVVALAALTIFLLPSQSLAAGAILLLGCLGVLFVNVVRAAQYKSAHL